MSRVRIAPVTTLASVNGSAATSTTTWVPKGNRPLQGARCVINVTANAVGSTTTFTLVPIYVAADGTLVEETTPTPKTVTFATTVTGLGVIQLPAQSSDMVGAPQACDGFRLKVSIASDATAPQNLVYQATLHTWTEDLG